MGYSVYIHAVGDILKIGDFFVALNFRPVRFFLAMEKHLSVSDSASALRTVQLVCLLMIVEMDVQHRKQS